MKEKGTDYACNQKEEYHFVFQEIGWGGVIEGKRRRPTFSII